MKAFHLAFSLAIVCAFAPALAASSVAEPDFHSSRARLEQVRRQIQQLQDQLRQEQKRQDQASARLRQADQAVAAVAQRLHVLERQQAEVARRVAALEQAVAEQQGRIGEHRELLARQLRAAYVNSQGSYLKVLLNADDPMRLGRMLAYHRYLQDARRQQMEAAAAALRELAALERRLTAEARELETLRQQTLASKQSLQAARAERAEALAAIEARLAAQGSQLERLQGDAAALEQLLNRLRDALADVRGIELSQQPFSSRRDQLDWPIDGQLLARFGQKRGIGEMRWNGVLIAGQEGQPVRSVARGHVVFADWLRGFGLLLIIDHGDGYMTLYGNNEAMFKEHGDWVQAGEIIAAVGTSGVPPRAGLYFEVRSGGKPVNPLQWLRPVKG